jgi:hypothetical protein
MTELAPELGAPVPEETLDPLGLDQILADLSGFGITDTEQMVTITVKGKQVNLRLSNLCVDDEITALVANLEIKGQVWVHQMRCDLLSRAVSWINGAKITDDLIATDPLTKEERPIRPILRNLLQHWGGEVVLVLWKIYMVHCQKVEDNLVEQLPDSVIMTKVEERFMQQIADELKAVGISAVTETLEAAMPSERPE